MTGRTTSLFAVLALGVVVLVAACGGKGDPNASPVAASKISMQGSEFLPNHATVTAGTTFERTFDEAGSFPYEWALHPGMVGRITVTTN